MIRLTLSGLLLTACNAGGTPTASAASHQPPIVVGGEVIAAPTPAAEAPERVVAQSQPSGEAHGEHGLASDRRPGPLAAGATEHYGAPFTITTPPVPLQQALATCVDGTTVCLVEATVSRVCQVSGCWFTVDAAGVDSVVRIRMKDYGFFVPRNALGATAVFEGTLVHEEVPQEEAQHYADDEAAAGGTRRVVSGPERTYEFMITGVRLTMP